MLKQSIGRGSASVDLGAIRLAAWTCGGPPAVSSLESGVPEWPRQRFLGLVGMDDGRTLSGLPARWTPRAPGVGPIDSLLPPSSFLSSLLFSSLPS